MKKHVEDVAFETLGQVSLITDFHGALTYSPDPTLVMTKYLDALPIGGELYFTLAGTYIIDPLDSEQRNPAASWVYAIEGVEPITIQRTWLLEEKQEQWCFGLKKCDSVTRVPKLELDHLEDFSKRPQTRIFLLKPAENTGTLLTDHPCHALAV